MGRGPGVRGAGTVLGAPDEARRRTTVGQPIIGRRSGTTGIGPRPGHSRAAIIPPTNSGSAMRGPFGQRTKNTKMELLASMPSMRTADNSKTLIPPTNPKKTTSSWDPKIPKRQQQDTDTSQEPKEDNIFLGSQDPKKTTARH